MNKIHVSTEAQPYSGGRNSMRGRRFQHGEGQVMPRCYSCGKYSKTAQKEWDGRAERVYCEFCIAERDWKLQDSEELQVPFPHLSWWSRIRSLFGKR